MSRYVILLLLNAPFILFALLNALVNYKIKKTSGKKFAIHTIAWLVIFTGLALAEPIYRFLFSNKLTNTEPLSLFDVIQITGIIFLLFVVSRYNARLENLDHQLQQLHRQVSIRLSEDEH